MESIQITTKDGIQWYVERFVANKSTGSADTVVLIPSGEGDCGNLRQLGELLGSSGYDTISFDNPGFSRTNAPKVAYACITPELFARQIMGLLDELGVHRAAFFGNSSGGCAALSIAALFPERVRCAIVHEVPLQSSLPLAEMKLKSDEEISSWCEEFFANHFIEQDENEGRAKWDALGPDYHGRLRRNYVVWIKNFVHQFGPKTADLATPESLQRMPVFWTVGGLSDRGRWAKDFEVADEAGITVRTDVLNCLHFPYVSIPETLRDWIVECVEQATA